MFGQQRDEKRAWVPNYDLFFFEVRDPVGHQDAARDAPRRDGQPGGLHAHPAPLPIGDLIRAFEPPYFRCIGRERWWTPLTYAWNELIDVQSGTVVEPNNHRAHGGHRDF